MMNYSNLQLLGKGSFGTVYKVKKNTNNKIFAMKQMGTSRLNTKGDIMNIITELKILCFHDCPFLLKCEEIFYASSKINIVVEYASFGDLNHYIDKHRRSNKKISEKVIWIVFIQCCFGVKYLHDHNIIHRDLKPANILLHKGNAVWLADFGVSKFLQERSHSKTIIGTPYYISPEMFGNLKYGKKVDIWALGCILYELMTLQVPFQSNNMKGLKHKIMHGHFHIAKNCGYSNDLIEMVNYLLQRNVNSRPTVQDIISNTSFKQAALKCKITHLGAFHQSFHRRMSEECNDIKDRNIDWNDVINSIHINNSNRKRREKLNVSLKPLAESRVINKYSLERPLQPLQKSVVLEKITPIKKIRNIPIARPAPVNKSSHFTGKLPSVPNKMLPPVKLAHNEKKYNDRKRMYYKWLQEYKKY